MGTMGAWCHRKVTSFTACAAISPPPKSGWRQVGPQPGEPKLPALGCFSFSPSFKCVLVYTSNAKNKTFMQQIPFSHLLLTIFIFWHSQNNTTEYFHHYRLFLYFVLFFSSMKKINLVHLTERFAQKRAIDKSPLEYPYPPIPLPTQKNSSEHNLFLAIFRETAAIIQEQWGSLFYSKSKCFVASNVNILINGIFFLTLYCHTCVHIHTELSGQKLHSTSIAQERNTTQITNTLTSEKAPS